MLIYLFIFILIVPNQLTEHLRNYLFPRKKLETVTDNRSLFKYLTNAFADEELPKVCLIGIPMY